MRGFLKNHLLATLQGMEAGRDLADIQFTLGEVTPDTGTTRGT
jgi:hypothetical protein